MTLLEAYLDFRARQMAAARRPLVYERYGWLRVKWTAIGMGIMAGLIKGLLVLDEWGWL